MSEKLLDLGNLYVSDFVESPEESQKRKKYPLDLVYSPRLMCPVLSHQPPSEMMWGKYWYRSSVNPLMRSALADVVADVQSHLDLVPNDIWLDIASNDGTLLSFVREDVIRVGIDPAEGQIHEECRSKAHHVVLDYFSKESYESIGLKRKAKIITCIAMFYDLQDPYTFVSDVEKCLDDEGLVVIQLSYTPLMVKQMAFDNIVSEHYAYHSLLSVEKIWGECGFSIVDVQVNDVNGGSIRVALRKKKADPKTWSTQPHRDICHLRYDALKKWEISNYDPQKVWKDFGQRLLRLKKEIVEFVKEQKSLGKTIWGYGASTKGNTLLQYFDLNSSLIDAIAEKSEWKFGLYTIGTNIPIKSDEEMREAHPDYLLLLPWHFVHEFSYRENEYLQRGGKFIIPCPKFTIYSKSGYEDHDR
jgi:hypothetical protein